MIVRRLLPVLITVVPGFAAAQPAWTVDASTTVDISATGPVGEMNFENPWRALRLNDGTIAVADAGSRKVHFFNASGAPLRSVGQVGAGPNEWQSVLWIGQCAPDSVFAFDPSRSRMTVLSANGDIVRQFVFRDSGGPPGVSQMSCSRSGAIAYLTGTGRGGTPPVMEVSGDLVSRSRFTDPPRRARGIRMGEFAVLGGGAMPRPLGPQASIAISDSRVYVGVGDSSRLLAYSLDAAQQSTVPLQVQRRTPSRAMHDASIQRSLSMVPLPARGRASQMAATVPLRDQMPTHGDIFADPTGTLWITTTFPGDPATRLLAVDQNGRTLGSLTLPRNIAVHEVGRDYVIGLYSDEDELPHIVVYRFRRGE